MTADASPVPRSDGGTLHYRAEAHTPDRVPRVRLLGIWKELGQAQQSCREHDEADQDETGLPLAWRRLYNGLWEAQGGTHRYQVVLILGPLA